ncbi:unnamed protein product [Heligmosomoides polygyrus]|uniref:Uncharacterized protein n=1 Tax=Heligmosomoides polygyrus TaxID=6339 RepID=A0A183G2G7_HELPZ|nr:unnamed protein product [Heligmosomoides polygyrus]
MPGTVFGNLLDRDTDGQGHEWTPFMQRALSEDVGAKVRKRTTLGWRGKREALWTRRCSLRSHVIFHSAEELNEELDENRVARHLSNALTCTWSMRMTTSSRAHPLGPESVTTPQTGIRVLVASSHPAKDNIASNKATSYTKKCAGAD